MAIAPTCRPGLIVFNRVGVARGDIINKQIGTIASGNVASGDGKKAFGFYWATSEGEASGVGIIVHTSHILNVRYIDVRNPVCTGGGNPEERKGELAKSADAAYTCTIRAFMSQHDNYYSFII